jgi:hypothetical protein
MALPDWTGPNDFGEMLNRNLAAERVSYLAFAIRTDWARHPHHQRNVERCLGDVLRLQERHRLLFCRPDEACVMIDAGGSVDAIVGPSGRSSSLDRRASTDAHR